MKKSTIAMDWIIGITLSILAFGINVWFIYYIVINPTYTDSYTRMQNRIGFEALEIVGLLIISSGTTLIISYLAKNQWAHPISQFILCGLMAILSTTPSMNPGEIMYTTVATWVPTRTPLSELFRHFTVPFVWMTIIISSLMFAWIGAKIRILSDAVGLKDPMQIISEFWKTGDDLPPSENKDNV